MDEQKITITIFIIVLIICVMFLSKMTNNHDFCSDNYSIHLSNATDAKFYIIENKCCTSGHHTIKYIGTNIFGAEITKFRNIGKCVDIGE